MRRPTAEDLETRPINYRNPVAIREYPRSIPYYGAARIPPNMEVPSQWSPYGTFQPEPYAEDMPQSLMSVVQAETYDMSPNPWPNNSQFDKPNGFFGALLRLQPHTSAHPGKSFTTGPGPTMLFHAPPVFSLQTRPITAVGV